MLVMETSGFSMPAPANFGTSLSNGSAFSIDGSGFGTKSGSLTPLVKDIGNAPAGTLDHQWTGGWPNACTNTNFNLQNWAVGTTYTGSVIGAPHPFVNAVIGGAHGEAGGATAGYNVIPWVTIVPPTFPYMIYSSHYTKADPQWVFRLANGEYNYKMYNFSIGSVPYGAVYWYWNFGPTGVPDNTVQAYYVGNDNAGGLMNPDANGHGNFWPSSSFPGTPKVYTPWYPGNGWVYNEFEMLVTNAQDLASFGYQQWWNGPCNLCVDYRGSTDAMSDPHRSFGLEGYSVQYAFPTNFRYIADARIEVSSTIAAPTTLRPRLARVVFGNQNTWLSSTIRATADLTSWTPTNIKGKFNQTVFTSGQTVYAHVLTESGTIYNNAKTYTVH